VIDSSDKLKLVDFGLARVMRESMARISGVTSPGGTIHYMSPQQAEGQKARATDDLYSLGATLYDLLTSTPPFHTGDVAYQVHHTRPQPLSERLMELELSNDIPAPVEELIQACLSKDPQARPQNAAEVLAWLDRGAPTALVMPPPAPPLPARPAMIVTPVSPPAPVPPAEPEFVPVPVVPMTTGRSSPRFWIAAAIVLLAGAAWWWKQAPDSPLAGPLTNAVPKAVPQLVVGATNAAPAAEPRNLLPTVGEKMEATPVNPVPVPPAAPGTWTTLPSLGKGRVRATAVWTGQEMMVWGGGTEGVYFGDGFAIAPETRQWRAVSLLQAPSARAGHAAVWTGSEMLIWGGREGWDLANFKENGGRYQLSANLWRPLSAVNAPRHRSEMVSVWTGTEMIVWGGQAEKSELLGDGGRYHPATDRWLAIASSPLAPPRLMPFAVWTGEELVVWGGYVSTSPNCLNSGFRYHPGRNVWRPISQSGAPAGRAWGEAVWTGTEVLVWGGTADATKATCLDDGAAYNPATDTWRPLPSANAPSARMMHCVGWTGQEMVVWGGMNRSRSPLDSGAT
jgi:hypothetical protein